MKLLRNFWKNICILFAFAFLLVYSTDGYPAHIVADLRPETILKNPNKSEGNLKNLINCKREVFVVEDVLFLNNSDVFVITKNITIHASDYIKENGNVFACLESHNNSKKLLITDCKERYVYDSHEFQLFSNRSVSLYGEIIPPEEYDLKDGKLYICADDSDYDDSISNTTTTGIRLSDVSKYVGKIGSGISIIALIFHLIIFCFLPTLWNLPGYNLTSLGVALLLAYSFVLIGQIPEVIGVSCVISGVLQQNFFLVAFFCMNVMAFDVWKTLKLATQKFRMGSNKVRKFVWYSLYAWGCPLIISSAAILSDNIEGVPENIKPRFGENDVCWMNNNTAKALFFAFPAFTVFVINAVLFISSSVMISRNSMKSTNDQQKQTVKFNHVLYLRLGIMMGISWLLGVLGLIWKNNVVWFIHDVLNSLQGLFMFLLFTCTRKVVKLLRERFDKTASSTSSGKQSTCSSKFESQQL